MLVKDGCEDAALTPYSDEAGKIDSTIVIRVIDPIFFPPFATSGAGALICLPLPTGDLVGDVVVDGDCDGDSVVDGACDGPKDGA